MKNRKCEEDEPIFRASSCKSNRSSRDPPPPWRRRARHMVFPRAFSTRIPFDGAYASMQVPLANKAPDSMIRSSTRSML